MERLEMQTSDLAELNFRKLAALFPNAVTETISDSGELLRCIDADVLRQEISASVIEGTKERYQFTWPDKRKSVVLANQPIPKTLRLERNKSVGRDGALGSIETGNIYIEGDNLDALKLLQETYLGRVKMIYIDPPYNTGSDEFVYNDLFELSANEFASSSGQNDAEGNILFDLRVNNESNGRFHTDWLNMIYPRLRIAKDLLSEDGVIFISIDDNELENLKKCCDEIFGTMNHIVTIVWEKMYTTKNDSSDVSRSHEYVLLYCKNRNECKLNLLPRTEEMDARYKNIDNDPRGPWKPIPLYGKGERKNGRYPVISPITGKTFYPSPDSHWLYRQADTERMIKENRIYFGKDGNSQPNIKRFLSEVQQGLKPRSLWSYKEVGSNDSAKKELKELYPDGSIPFDFPKPVTLIQHMLQIATDDDSIVLDFFSGSATTAHAVMKYNSENNGNRRFILVQLPEKCDEKSDAYKRGYANICDIGEDRIRRAGRKIKDDNPLVTNNLDVGFRVFCVDSTNMKDVYYRPTDYDQRQIDLLADNIKEDRTPEDLLIQVMLELGVELSSKIEEVVLNGKKVFSVADGYLLACFDSSVSEDVVKSIAQKKPFYAVFRDSGMASDSVAANFEQLFETYSPKTQRKVL